MGKINPAFNFLAIASCRANSLPLSDVMVCTFFRCGLSKSIMASATACAVFRSTFRISGKHLISTVLTDGHSNNRWNRYFSSG